jgi:uncharacterized membrane protein
MKNKLAWIEAALLAAPFAAALALWDKLPARIPVHWNLAGQVDRWSSSRWEILLLPLLSVALIALLRVLPRLDPKLRVMTEIGRMAVALQISRITIACCVGTLFVVQLASALEWPLPTARIVQTALLLLLAISGNYLGNLRPNYFFGIRTPWTLEDPDTWRATHRLGGQLLFFGSLTLLVVSFVLSDRIFVPTMIGALGAFVLWSLLYSWHDYRRRHARRAA